MQTPSNTSPTRASQASAEKQQYQERMVTVILGRATAEAEGKSLETLKKIA